MTFGSLFAGIGGFDLGLERAGMECRWQVEIDPFCQRVLAKHWPNVPRFGDIKTIQEGQLERVDLICGGFPCQPWSVAGKREGIKDERWLWPDFARVVRMVGPRYVLVENVPGLLDGGGVDAVLGGLAELGFDAEWQTVSASFLGAPHVRKRVFILADAKRERGARLVESAHPCDIGPWRMRGAEDLFAVADAPFQRNDRWPQPLLRGVDDGLPGRVAGCRAFGNAVVPQVAEWIGRCILEADRRTA